MDIMEELLKMATQHLNKQLGDYPSQANIDIANTAALINVCFSLMKIQAQLERIADQMSQERSCDIWRVS